MMMDGPHGRGSASGAMISSASGGRRPRRAAGQWPTSAKVRQRRPIRSRRGAGGSPGHPVSRPRRPLVSASTQPSGRKKSFHARVAHESHGSARSLVGGHRQRRRAVWPRRVVATRESHVAMPAAEPPPTRLRYVDGVVGLFRPWMTDRRPAQGGCRHTSDAIEEKRAINIAGSGRPWRSGHAQRRGRHQYLVVPGMGIQTSPYLRAAPHL